MTDLWKKLNLKAQDEIFVVGAPTEFEPALAALPDVKIRRRFSGSKPIDFFLGFVTKETEIEKATSILRDRAVGDAVVWFAYPKRTSKRYESQIHRDRGWASLDAAGFRGVRAVAIDEDWSALRFRRTEFVKSSPRPRA